MEITILGKDLNVLKNFNTIDDFNKYYTKHKEEMDQLTTKKLNKLYKIDGYRISKKDTRDKEGHLQQGTICLKKLIEPKIDIHELQKQLEELKSKLQIQEQKLKNQDQKINIITDRFNELIDKLQPSST